MGDSTKSLLGRLTKVTIVGSILALVFLAATTAQPKSAGTARPFKASGIPTLDFATGTFEFVGTATHLGSFVFPGTFTITEIDGPVFHFHITS